MNRSLFVCFIVCCFFFSSPCVGQDLPMLHYTVEEGLPSNNVYSVYRDSKGYIWMGTDKGVARYNGIKFEVFSSYIGLPDNEVFFFREDKYGRLWLGAFNGELCYYKDGVFHTKINTPFLRLPFVETHTRYISNEQDSSIIISYDNPRKILVIDSERCTVFDMNKLDDTAVRNSLIFARKISDNEYELICTDRIATTDTLYHVTSVRKTDERFINRKSMFVSCQNQDHFYNSRCLFTFDMKLVRTFPDNFIKPYFLNQVYMNDKGVYYATINGVFINDSLQILQGRKASAVTQDGVGNYWISTLNDGVYVLKDDFSSSKLYRNAYSTVAKYAHAMNGHLFFTTAGNDLFELNKGKVDRLFNYAVYAGKDYNYPIDFGFMVSDNYGYYNIYNNDYTASDNLLHRKPQFITGDTRLSGTKEICLSQGYLYLKLPHSINRLRDTGPNSNGISTMTSIGQSAGFERIFVMAKASDNSIWYATIHKVYRVDSSMEDGVLQPQFSNYSFKSFDFFGEYLVGYTQDNQLLVCRDYNSHKIKVDTVLKRNCIWDKFYRIDPTHVLISTNNFYRLLTLYPVTDSPRYLLHAVENPFIPLHADAISSDGKNCYFLKNGTITVVDDSSLFEKAPPPKLFFTLMKTDKATYAIKDEMQLPFNEARTLSIKFAATSFGGSDIKYQYSFSKEDQDEWRDLAGEEINLVNPVFGAYVLKVKAKTISSENCVPIVFKLNILRPYWATLWFNLAVLLSIIIVVGIAIRYRILYVLRQKEKDHETEIKFMRSEYKALNALMNPHFIFNTLNNVQGLVNRNDRLAANEYIRIFADLIRQNMHNISKDLISLQKEMDLVANYLLLEKLRFKEHLNYSINIDDDTDLTEVMVPPLLVQPLVENSIKHGILPLESGDGVILINVYERKGVLYIEVKDNGVGMNNAGNSNGGMHESFGLKNVRQRIQQLSIFQSKEISFNTSEERDGHGKLQWTIVTIGIPHG